MNCPEPFADIHCHMLPGLDDGPANEDESLGMAAIAAADGIGTVVVTPHQSGGYPQNTAETIRRETLRLQEALDRRGIDLHLLPGADIRIEPDVPSKIRSGELLTLADRGRHLLLELPRDIYIPLDRLLDELLSDGIVGILSHPERNRGILHQPQIIRRLSDQGCLIQITAGSLSGMFGSQVRNYAEWLVKQGLVQFISTDAHGVKSRPPLLSDAFQRVAQWIGLDAAVDLCCRNPAQVAAGMTVPTCLGTPRNRRRPAHCTSKSSPRDACFSHPEEI
jgi:protein-tyrosine phosphatase